MFKAVEIYYTRPLFVLRKQWWWRMRSANYRIIGASTEGYNNFADMVANLHEVVGLSTVGIEPSRQALYEMREVADRTACGGYMLVDQED